LALIFSGFEIEEFPMTTWRLFWGLVLIGIGGLFLADNIGLIAFNLAMIWPLVLIFFGTFVLLGPRLGSGGSEMEHMALPLENASEAQVSIEHGAGRLILRGPAPAGQLVEGDFSAVELHSRHENGKAILSIKSRVDGWVTLPWNWGGGPFTWDFGLTGQVPIKLRVQSGANSNELDLSELQVKSLKLETGASSSKIKLPRAAGHTIVDIDCGASSVDITVPDGVAADIRVDSGMADIAINKMRFPRNGKHYTSPDYAEAANKVDIDIDTGMSSVRIH
jgi:hypothetical protein